MKITRNLCRGLVIAIAVICSPPAATAEPIRVVLEFVPDIDNGRRSFEICARCHLPEAWGNDDGTYPQLAGQHVNVLMKQLLDIRSGRRDNPTMQPFVQQRTIGGYQNLADVVAYISTLPMNPAHARGPWPPDSPEYLEGKRLYSQHCAGCHGAMGEGNNELSYPRLQGQHYEYMARQARLARDRLRQVAPSMTSLIVSLSVDDFDQALNYVSYLPLPAGDLAPDADWRNPDFQ
ncbi:MAG: c-type cytochrome [Gammaproteobacteria bacterium]|nr:c-type cytochrome [Gammaproteobacteria bacterium]MDH3537423.1 c-type cytochrome [Gammaproteobacteria bacterium]